MENSAELLPCVQCSKVGWTDQRTLTDRGYMCVRCARPDIDWERIDNIGAKNNS